MYDAVNDSSSLSKLFKGLKMKSQVVDLNVAPSCLQCDHQQKDEMHFPLHAN